ncbi:MAG: site-specific integrase [Rhodospirillaceae bacterium]
MALKKRSDSSTFLSRMRVPKDLVAVYKRKHLEKSLHTSDEKAAKVLDKIQVGEWYREFEHKRRVVKGETTLTTEQCREQALLAIRKYREYEHGDMGDDQSFKWEAAITMNSLHEEYECAPLYANNALKMYVDDNPGILGIDVDAIKSIIRDEYDSELLRRMNRIIEIGIADVPDFIKYSPPPTSNIETSSFSMPAITNSTHNIYRGGAISLHNAIELTKKQTWWSELPEKTRDGYNTSFNLIVRLYGKDREVHTLMPEDSLWIRNIIDNMYVHFPKNGDVGKLIEAASISRAFGNENVQELISNGTKNKHRTAIKKIFKTLLDNWYIKSDMTANFKPWSNMERKKTRVQFTDCELKKIIMKTSADRNDHEMFWIPLIAIFTGARRGEICQLMPSDIVLMDGIWVFRISSEGDGQSLKNRHSFRFVPIHTDLIRLGLLEYVAINKNNNNGRIWKNLVRTKSGWGDAFGKRFSRATTGLFEEKPKTCKDFHSFRHTVKERLDKHLDLSILDALLGWSSEERRVFERVQSRRRHTRDGYGTDMITEKLRDGIEMLKYPWLII